MESSILDARLVANISNNTDPLLLLRPAYQKKIASKNWIDFSPIHEFQNSTRKMAGKSKTREKSPPQWKNWSFRGFWREKLVGGREEQWPRWSRLLCSFKMKNELCKTLLITHTPIWRINWFFTKKLIVKDVVTARNARIGVVQKVTRVCLCVMGELRPQSVFVWAGEIHTLSCTLGAVCRVWTNRRIAAVPRVLSEKRLDAHCHHLAADW